MTALLAFDCSGGACSAAVVAGGTVLAERFAPMERGHAESLLVQIRDVMEESGLTFRDLDALATTVGPGSFTGLRIGLAAARGLALATGRPLLAPTAFEAYLAQVADSDGRCVVAAIDSRRGPSFVQAFAPDGAPIGEPAAIDAEAATGWLADRPTIAVGDGTACFARLTRRGLVLRPGHLRASDVARAAVSAPARPAVPLYLRPPDVTMPR